MEMAKVVKASVTLVSATTRGVQWFFGPAQQGDHAGPHAGSFGISSRSPPQPLCLLLVVDSIGCD
eukprot:SAG25_NODE_9830_length_356_cov_0.797665_1_plen_64_part_10